MISKRFFKTKEEVEVTFELDVPETASNVAIVAEFLNWKPEPMKKIAKSSTYKYKVRLPKCQEYQFRYLLGEGQWINDPHADKYIPNAYGGENSLVSTYS